MKYLVSITYIYKFDLKIPFTNIVQSGNWWSMATLLGTQRLPALVSNTMHFIVKLHVQISVTYNKNVLLRCFYVFVFNSW